MVSSVISRIVILVFGTLYPAYASYKAVKTKNVKEYVKWMMYWIIFALFTCIETFSDIFASFWVPFYYELKILFVLWLLSPYTQGSSILYRRFVHPQLNKREHEIDEFILQFREKGYEKLVELGSKGMALATNVVLQTAIKGQETLVNQIKKSYSMSDLSQTHLDNKPVTIMPYIEDEVDGESEENDNVLRREKSNRRALRDRHSLSYREISDSGDEDVSSSSLGHRKNRKHKKQSVMNLRSRESPPIGGGGFGVNNSKSIYDEVSAYATLTKKTTKRVKKKKPPTSE